MPAGGPAATLGRRRFSTPARGSPLSLEREYDAQLSHTIWELERAIQQGRTSESLRRALIEAHAQHLRHMEEIAQVPRHQRSMLLLQPRPTDGVLLLAGENAGADEMQPLADYFHKRGCTALATSLRFRALDPSVPGPLYWQTCADEAENRYDMLAHWSTRVAVVGSGMAGLIALHLAARRRVSHVVACFPTLGVEASWLERLRAGLRRLVRRDSRMPAGWGHQRQLAARQGRETLVRLATPLFVLTEDRDDRSEAGRSARLARRLANRAATRVRVLRAGEAASVRELSSGILDEMLAFLSQT